MVDLTVVILTKNEEKNIEKCINSFRGIAKRFVVVDSFSTDSTKDICLKLGVDFYENKFIDYATQFNWALKNTNITTKWTMRMDADEELTPELAKEIEEKLPKLESDITGVILKRRVYFMGKWIKHGGVYPQLLLRIFRTGYGECEQKVMDEHIILKEGRTVTFKYDLIDNNTKRLEWWINKHNWYSNREVIDYFNLKEQIANEKVIKGNLFGGQAEMKRWLKNNIYLKAPLFRRAHWYFLYRYFFRLGFLDGKEGLIYHFLQGYWYRFLVDAKIYECMITGKKITNQGELNEKIIKN
jgi:glycosyltransferase involved in cell wall biosynthesis